MTFIHALPTPESKRSESTIDLLKEMLVRAESGEITQIIIIGFSVDDHSHLYMSPLTDTLRKIGAIRQIEWDLMKSRDEI